MSKQNGNGGSVCSVMEATSVNRERLRYVTENFDDLNGLGQITSGAACLVLQLGWYWHKEWLILLGLLSMSMAALLELIFFRRYYRRRFGFIAPRKSGSLMGANYPFTKKQTIVGGISIAVLVILFYRVTPPGNTNLMPLPFAFLFLWLGLRRNCRKLHDVVLGLTLAFIALFPFWGLLNEKQLVFWRFLDFSCIGLVLIISGVCDHILLSRLMAQRVSEADGE